MTNHPDNDTASFFPGKQPGLDLLSSDDEERAGIRVTRAEFSRMMGCSRQAVTDWANAGRIVVGADGRFDPRQAVASLLRTGDPARIRAKVLEPMVRDIGKRDQRIADLEAQLAAANEQKDFNQAVGDEYQELFEAFDGALAVEWSDLLEHPAGASLAALRSWLETALQYGASNAGSLIDHLADAFVDAVARDDAELEGAAPASEAEPLG